MPNPTPADVQAARKAAGLTQTQAAALVGKSLAAWKRYESTTKSHTPIPALVWEAFLSRAGLTPPPA